MKKKFLFVILLLGFFIPVKTLGLSGDISFSCNATTVNVGDEVRCKIVGTSDGQVSEIFSNLTSDGNIIVTNFKAERIWKINSEWPNLSLTSADKYPGNFEMGTVYLKAVASGVGTFYMNGTTFTGDDGAIATIPNKSVVITVISNVPEPTPTPEPTPVPDPTPVEPVKSSDATLKSLMINDIDINFNPLINEYNVEVGSNANTIKIEAVANDTKAVVKLPDNLFLVTGPNQFLVVVTAEDGTVLTYKINVTKLEKLLSNNALLSSLKIDGYDLKFSSDVFEYNIGKIKNNFLDISAITEDSSATVVIIGNSNIGKDDSIIIKVTSEAGNVNKYIIYASYEGEVVVVQSNDKLLIIVSLLFVFSSALVLLLVVGKRKKKKKVITEEERRRALDAEEMKRKKEELRQLELQVMKKAREEQVEVRRKETGIKADDSKVKEALEKLKKEKEEQARLDRERQKQEREAREEEERKRALLEKEEKEKARLLNEERLKAEKEKALLEKEERERQKKELEEKMRLEKLAKIEREKAEKERLKREKEEREREKRENLEKMREDREREKREKIEKDKEYKELEAKAREEREKQKRLDAERAKAEKERLKKEKEEQALLEKQRKLEEKFVSPEKEKLDIVEKKKEEAVEPKKEIVDDGRPKISSEAVQAAVKVAEVVEEVAPAPVAEVQNKDGFVEIDKSKIHMAVEKEKKETVFDATDIGAPEVDKVVNSAPVVVPVAQEEPEVLDMDVMVISPEQVLSAVKTNKKKEETKVDSKKNSKKGKK